MEPHAWEIVAGIVAALAAITGVVAKFNAVSVQFGELWQATKEHSVTIAAVAGKTDLLRTELSEHKVDVARNYATNADVQQAIDRLENTLRQYLDAIQRTR